MIFLKALIESLLLGFIGMIVGAVTGVGLAEAPDGVCGLYFLLPMGMGALKGGVIGVVVGFVVGLVC